jgi:hypothetical protein
MKEDSKYSGGLDLIYGRTTCEFLISRLFIFKSI